VTTRASRARITTTVALLALIGIPTAAEAKPVDVIAPGDENLHARAFKASQREKAWQAAGARPEERLEWFKRTATCDDDPALEEPGIDQPCYLPPGVEITGPPCEDGPAIEPLWHTFRTTLEAEWQPWELIVGWSCPEHLLPPVGIEELRVLSIAPPEVGIQPSGEMLVNKPTILYTSDEPQTFDTEVSGFEVEIIAEPIEWEWEFDDGERLTTGTPGEPYPSFDVTHTFSEALENSTIGLTTSWRGRYRVAADPLHKWRAIDGTATTESTSDPFDVIELRTRLVD
jgi:hypothetical protein